MSWRRFWRRRGADVDLAQEIDLYLARGIDENIACGMSPDQPGEPAGAFPIKSFRQYRETLEMGIDWMAFLEWSFEESDPPLHR
jgi:hypothetical protein